MNTRRILTVAAALGLLAAHAAPAAAIPAFARKYGVSCSLCHSAPPKLNAFGETFAGNGFELVPGEPPRDTINTGDPLLRLQRDLPLAVRLDAYAAFQTDAPQDATSLDLQTPWLIKLLSGGQIADKVSYYMYFFLSERGEVAGLEDAYVQFTDVFDSGISLMVGQFQVSDPLFKRELRLTVEDYQPYRVRVGDARADLTYERGVMAVWSPWEGGDIAAGVVAGRGIDHATERRVYDTDNWKNLFGRVSHEFGALRLGAFAYWANEEQDGIVDEMLVWGPDATLALGSSLELNAQFLRRTDDDPFFLGAGSAETTVDSWLGELTWYPQGHTGRLFLTGIFNHVTADGPVFTVRAGEETFLEQYTYGAGSLSWLLRRNLRLIGEAGWDFERDNARITAGFSAAM